MSGVACGDLRLVRTQWGGGGSCWVGMFSLEIIVVTFGVTNIDKYNRILFSFAR